MNKLEKRSLFSFLLLYLSSSLLFLSFAAYWYFSTQKLSLENIHYYKMQHSVDAINTSIVMAHMKQENFCFNRALDNFKGIEKYQVGFFDDRRVKVGGNLTMKNIDFFSSYYQDGEKKVLVSTGSFDHLNIHYVVLVSEALPALIQTLTLKVSAILFLSFIMVGLIGWRLSKMFLRPIHQKIQEIEHFIKDITHELNTPITALLLSSKRLKEKAYYDEKIVRNISISTKQLFDMYNALAFTSFSHSGYRDEELSFSKLVQESIEYFDELLGSKEIKLISRLLDKDLFMDTQKAKMLINNILSNAIKHSMTNSTISVELTETSLLVTDEGIGIEKEKLGTVFKRFTRASDYSGGFGVGLSVVKHICDDYGFKVEVESIINKGTSVKIIF